MTVPDWTRKITPDDPQWEQAERAARMIAHTLGYRYVQGAPTAPPLIVNDSRACDRMVAYHGFDGTWVGWY